MSHNWISAQERILKALGLWEKSVLSVDISIRPGHMPTVDVVFDIGFDEKSSELITELRRYELVEREVDE